MRCGTRGRPTSALIDRGNMVTCGSMRTSHSLPWPATAWVSVEPRLANLKSLHTQPPGAKRQPVLERYHGAYGASIKRDRMRASYLGHWYSLGVCFTPVEPLSPRIHADTYTSSMINLVPQTSLPIPHIPRRPWPGPQS